MTDTRSHNSSGKLEEVGKLPIEPKGSLIAWRCQAVSLILYYPLAAFRNARQILRTWKSCRVVGYDTALGQQRRRFHATNPHGRAKESGLRFGLCWCYFCCLTTGKTTQGCERSYDTAIMSLNVWPTNTMFHAVMGEEA